MTPAGFAHSEIRGSSGQVPLTAAYRSLSRPSSASCAKASTVCPYHLLFDGSNILKVSRRLAPPRLQMRSSLRKIFRHAMQLSRYGEGEPSRPDTARPGGATKASAGLAGTSAVMLFSSKEAILPRKEVIQPHLPVRLPCYDFTPLAPHTFDASAPCGFGRRLRVQTTRVV